MSALIGPSSGTVVVEESFIDPGAIAFDNVEGDITDQIVVVNPVDTALIGVYTMTYNVADSSGNAAVTVTRTVSVVARQGSGGGGGGGGALAVSMLLFLALLLGLRRVAHANSSRRPS